MKTIAIPQLSTQVSGHEAKLCSIRSNGKEYLWQAGPAFWKRHSPALFPIVGSVWEPHYAGEFKDKDWMQHLAPGETFQGGYTIVIE